MCPVSLSGKRIAKRDLGGSKCTYGPSYWCSSNESARDCNVSKENAYLPVISEFFI